MKRLINPFKSRNDLEIFGQSSFVAFSTIDGSNMIFQSLTFARSRPEKGEARAFKHFPRDLANVNE